MLMGQDCRPDINHSHGPHKIPTGGGDRPATSRDNKRNEESHHLLSLCLCLSLAAASSAAEYVVIRSAGVCLSALHLSLCAQDGSLRGFRS